MSERQGETPLDHSTKPETNSEQSWVYSSLLQMVYPVTRLADNLGKLVRPWTAMFDNREIVSWKNTDEDNKRLINLWSKPNSPGVVFISLHAFTRKDDETKIRQIGMTGWQPNNFDFMNSVCTEVEQDKIYNNSLLPQLTAGKFLYGDTEVIFRSDIGPWLRCTFKALQGSQHTACLVGYDIRRTLQLVQPYWSVPRDILILDIQTAQGFQVQTSEQLTFRQLLERSTGYTIDESLLDNAGNAAQLILQSFQTQVRKTEYIMESHHKTSTVYLTRPYNGYRF